VGAATTSSINIAIHSSATATITVVMDGRTFTASADKLVLDGWVVVACTGLSPGVTYPYTVDGEAWGAVRTQQVNPQTAVVASGSCWSASKRDVLSEILVARGDVDLMIWLGDAPYCATTYSGFGETPVSVESSIAAGQDPENYRSHYRQFGRIPGINEAFANLPSYRIRDDHEVPWDNGSPFGFADYQAYMPGGAEATQEDFDLAWAVAEQVAVENTGGFTHGFDSDVTPADTNAMYGSYKIGELVEVFVWDCVGYKSATQDADTSSKTMLGAAQKARFIDAIGNSTATWKLVASPKSLFHGGSNTDSWHAQSDNLGYETEKAEILYAIRNVTGVLFVGGDQHLWSDQSVAAGELGTDMPAVNMLLACPTSVDVNTSGVTGYYTGVKTKFNGYPLNTVALQDNVVAVFEFTPARAYRHLLSTRRGLIGCGYIDAGSNHVQYPRARIG
jgi:phosphodiesterase/alkaline phosphatase D-like protein